MKKTFQKFLLILFFVATQIHCGGATSSGLGGTDPSDPVDLPAPVSHLSISSPSEAGLVRITAPAGFADAATDVTIAASASSSLSSRTSFSSNLQDSAFTTNDDGSFQIELDGAIADEFTITYTENGEETSGTGTVPEHQPPLPLGVTLQDIGLDTTFGLAFILATDSSNAFVYVINLSDASLEATVEIAGGTGATRIAVDSRTGGSAIIDDAADVVYEIRSDYLDYDTVAVEDPLDIVAGGSGNFYMISQAGDTNFSYYSVAMNMATGYTGVTSGAATAVESPLVDSIFDSQETFAMVTEMSDASFHLFSFLVEDSNAISQLSDTELTEVSSPTGLALFDGGAQALVADSAADAIFLVDLTSNDVTEIAVGDTPLGVVVDEDNSIAYVICNGDDALNVVDLNSQSVSSTVDLGLNPTQIGLRTGSDLLSVTVNTGDNTLNIIE